MRVHTSISLDVKLSAPVEEELEEDYEDDDNQVPEDATNEMGVMQLLRQHREDADESEEFIFGSGYEEEEY